jgi:RNA polymerase sigma-70 factor, ECF subfamily
MAATSRAITRLLDRVTSGDQQAEAELLESLYGELHRLATRHMRGERASHTLQPTALVNEAYVRLLRGAGGKWRDRMHFLAVASTVMRRVLVDHARRRTAGKRGSGAVVIEMHEDDGAYAPSPETILAVDEALTELSVSSPRQARIVELRFFAGLTEDEIAELLGVSSRTVKRDWIVAKARLYTRLRS